MNKQDNERIAILEANYDNLKDSLNEIKDNHLVHIIEDIKTLFRKFDKLQLLIITNLIGIIFIFLQKYIK